MKALIKVGYGCNDHCLFCHTLDVRHVQGSVDEVTRKIVRAHALGHDEVVFSGGEPTIRPELLDWAERVHALGMGVGLVTNGRMLSYPALVDALCARGLRYVYLSLHGGSARIHDGLVRTRAFAQSHGALGVLSGRGLDLTVNCVVTRQNVEHLRELVDAVLVPYPDVRLKFSMVEPKGGGAALFEHLVPRVAHVADRVLDAFAYARDRLGDAIRPRLRHGAIPLCLLPGHEDLYDDLRTHGFATMSEVGEADFFPVDDRNKVQPESCDGCALRGPCPGLYRGYWEAFGAGELRPVRDARPRGNSLHWVFERLVATGVGADECPLRDDGVDPWDRGRHLFVWHQGRVGRYRTGSRDFPDVEIERIKLARGQVYLDASRKRAPDDFGADLVPLVRSVRCGRCAHDAHCTGMYEPVFENVFERAQRRLARRLEGLSGRIVDVGCGDGPFDELLEPAVRAGTVDYVGIDPDAARLARTAARRGWGMYLSVGLEALTDEAGCLFDHALLLRSWNHLSDVDRGLARLRGLLRAGGSVLVADDEPFGLARTAAQATAAEGAALPFEHRRNHRASDAARALRAAGFEVVEVDEPEPGQGTLWTVVAINPSDRAAGSP
ncbi:MAG: radical SAM protein [Myxococcota bacterium]|nr:radical SAM protein [Myxococcota bacterium]